MAAPKKKLPPKGRHPRIDPKLSPREKAFVDEYLIDLSATKAAIRVGYSERSAHVLGSRLLQKPAVREAIEAAMAERSRKTGITADRVLEEIAAVAFSDLGEVIRVDEHGKVYVRELDGLRPEARRALSEVTQVTTESMVEDERVTEKVRLGVKLHNKVAALKLLVDHLGLNAPTKVEAKVETMSARDRLAAKLEQLACASTRS